MWLSWRQTIRQDPSSRHPAARPCQEIETRPLISGIIVRITLELDQVWVVWYEGPSWLEGQF